MQFLTAFIERMATEAETPPLYGSYHLACFAACLVLTVLFALLLRNASEGVMRRFLLAVLFVMLFVEGYKQLVFSFTVQDGVLVFDYRWYHFPYQLCSTPLYVLPFAALFPGGRVRDACLSYLATFSLLGGLAVLIYPGDVFVEMIGINIQTMVHHGLQVVVGVVVLVRLRGRAPLPTYLSAIPVFLLLLLVALTMNVGFYQLAGITINMFFIGPYAPCTLPIASIFYPLLPYPVFLFLYVLVLSLGAGLVFFGSRFLLRRVMCDAM